MQNFFCQQQLYKYWHTIIIPCVNNRYSLKLVVYRYIAAQCERKTYAGVTYAGITYAGIANVNKA